MISVTILTKNEEQNLPKCLESIRKLADEIIIVDDNSTDKTVEIAKNFGVKVFTHSLNNNFAQQHNFALRQAQGDWVLSIDADEVVSPELKKEIMEAVKEPNVAGFYFKRYDFWSGRLLKHGEQGKVRLLRLGKKGKGEWRREVHEVWEIEGETKELKNPLLHYSHQTLSDFIDHVNFHSTLHAQTLKKEGVKPSLWRIIFYPKAKFIQNYILRRGFLDGTPGIIVALMMSFHSFLARAKLYFLWKK